MLSSDFPSASIPSTNSVPAAITSSAAASAYPALTLQADPDSMSHPNRSGDVERVEAGDGQCTRFKWEYLTGGQIDRTRRRRCEEEDRKPRDRLRHRSEECAGK